MRAAEFSLRNGFKHRCSPKTIRSDTECSWQARFEARRRNSAAASLETPGQREIDQLGQLCGRILAWAAIFSRGCGNCDFSSRWTNCWTERSALTGRNCAGSEFVARRGRSFGIYAANAPRDSISWIHCDSNSGASSQNTRPVSTTKSKRTGRSSRRKPRGGPPRGLQESYPDLSQ